MMKRSILNVCFLSLLMLILIPASEAVYLGESLETQEERMLESVEKEEYENQLGLIKGEWSGFDFFLRKKSISPELIQTRIEIEREKVRVANERKIREAAEQEKTREQITLISRDRELIESGQYAVPTFEEKKPVFIFQISFLLMCGLVVLPFMNRNGRLLKILNELPNRK